MLLGGIVGQAVELAGQVQRVSEVIAAERPEVDPSRPRHGETADCALWIP
jgi:hypothetical protein